MKKLLLSSAILLMFSLSIFIFQISCSKSVDAQNSNNSVSQIGKLIYARDRQIWTANYDGSSQTQVPVTLPTNVTFAFGSIPQSALAISPDGQKIFFTAFNLNVTPKVLELYSVNFDGTGLSLVIGNGPVLGFYPFAAF